MHKGNHHIALKKKYSPQAALSAKVCLENIKIILAN